MVVGASLGNGGIYWLGAFLIGLRVLNLLVAIFFFSIVVFGQVIIGVYIMFSGTGGHPGGLMWHVASRQFQFFSLLLVGMDTGCTPSLLSQSLSGSVRLLLGGRALFLGVLVFSGLLVVGLNHLCLLVTRSGLTRCAVASFSLSV